MRATVPSVQATSSRLTILPSLGPRVAELVERPDEDAERDRGADDREDRQDQNDGLGLLKIRRARDERGGPDEGSAVGSSHPPSDVPRYIWAAYERAGGDRHRR